ncbi:MAG: DHH family phosphoesterase [Methanocorpusculum sp.]|jgi:nanoRNase/pAp phosphatase (c-di-AMP/oligoRNAs hydrolase)|nr:DHH family phosphoesterase [Methanocorpusculum sp.]MDD2470672.1 DHH family phosphoesterase [Methanocorpusculum sp.]MDD3257084.1 DHH family phosphoesterase [Methanocorpusculum sp.]MDD4132964.1 DHH family phosphoesterase [Methanocorpusculum sp.]
MSLEEAAKKIADRLRGMEYVEMYAHHDADGIASAAIMSIALKRAGIAFRLRFLPVLTNTDVTNPDISLLCDLGASCAGLPETTMIIDHHVPYNTSQYHINPRLFGADGETDLSAAGCAYLVANALLDNRDLAGLVLLGIIGDRQTLTGMNEKIIGEGIANNLINPGRGLLLAGRTTKEQIESASLPYLPGLSGNSEEAGDIMKICSDKTSDEKYLGCLLSEIIARSNASYDALMNLYGDCWSLEREVIRNAHSLTMVVDACGKAGRTELAFGLACGDASLLKEGWETALSFKKRVIESAGAAKKVAKNAWMVNSADTASDVADMFANSENKPVFVLGRADSYLKVSARAPLSADVNFEQFIVSAAKTFGGTGGGHKTRAGGELPLACEAEFVKSLEAFA